MKTSKSYHLSVAFFAGLVLLYLGERLIGVGTGRTVASLLGAACVIGATALRASRVSGADSPERASIEKAFLVLYGVGLAGLILYALQSDLMGRLLEKPFDQAFPKLAVSLA